MAVRQMSVWLRPERAAATELDAVIARLAGVHGTAAFPAHLTLLPTLERDAEGATACLGEVAELLDPLAVRFGETRCEPPWHRSLYLAALPDPALRRAFEATARAFGVPADVAFDPHMSLQYSELPIADKLRLAAEVSIDLPLTVRFDRLELWQTAGSDASRWRPIADRPLRSGARGRRRP